MATLITDPWLEERIRAQREAIGADRYDEVWEGVLRNSPRARSGTGADEDGCTDL